MKNKLKLIRAQKNLTQEQLADIAGISRPALAQIENEKTVPDGETIAKLVSALHMPAGDIFDELDSPVRVEQISDKTVCKFMYTDSQILLLEALLSKLKLTLNSNDNRGGVTFHTKDFSAEERESDIYNCVDLIVYFAKALKRSVECLSNPVMCGNYDDVIDLLWEIALSKKETEESTDVEVE